MKSSTFVASVVSFVELAEFYSATDEKPLSRIHVISSLAREWFVVDRQFEEFQYFFASTFPNFVGQGDEFFTVNP